MTEKGHAHINFRVITGLKNNLFNFLFIWCPICHQWSCLAIIIIEIILIMVRWFSLTTDKSAIGSSFPSDDTVLGIFVSVHLPPGQLNRDQGVLGQVLNAGKKSAIFLKIGSLPCPISLPHTRALRTFVSLSDAGGRREKTREDPAAGMSHKPLSHEEREPAASTSGRRWPGFVSMFLSFQVY